jgi:hypothetical protein
MFENRDELNSLLDGCASVPVFQPTQVKPADYLSSSHSRKFWRRAPLRQIVNLFVAMNIEFRMKTKP